MASEFTGFSLSSAVRLVLGGTLCLVIIVYIIFQGRFLLLGPGIALATELPLESSKRSIVVDGVASRIVSLTLNGKPIYTNDEGYFQEDVILENGYTVLTIEAKDRYGRMTRLERSVVFNPINE